MATYDITRVKADMEAALHGTTVNQITNLYGLFDRAARDVLTDIDPNETMRFSAPVSLHTGVYSYTCPTDLKGNRIFDIRPQADRRPWDGVAQTFSQNFDRIKNSVLSGALVNVKWNAYVKSLNIAVNQQPVVMLNSCDTFDGNGTWTAGTNVTDVATDNLNFVEGTGSVRFDLTSTTGYIENSAMDAVDMTDLDPEGELYLWVWMPTGSEFNSVTLRWGSSASDYWEATATVAQDGTAFATGWNLLAFSWPSSDTGTPDVSSVTYLRVAFDCDSAQNPVRIDAVTSSLGQLFEVGYYSKYLFRDAVTGAFKENVTSDTDLLNLDTDSYQVFFNRCMVLASQQKQGVDAMQGDMQFFAQEYEKSKNAYNAKYPSQVQKTQQPYYSFRKRSYANYFGRGFNW